ncbi:uncharacterized protein LOC119678340 isoform X2 [Teleopsis dalmanni]|uniref:uncharacterized protein LOC119678340 isoform X2 n=2 Tax=Teleopsis dalmanni TaxID=139649 RepID=UPI0018CE8AFF|nr:uncharacterized protein LOC119678340 isoform X2 [Teleopsis dalmanni]
MMPKFEFILSAMLMMTLTLLLVCLGFISAERDFNFNDSQVPLLEPKDEPIQTHYNQDPYAAEISARCHYTDTEIMLSLVLKNHDWHDLSDNKKAKVLDKLSKFFAIPKDFITVESVTKRDLYEMEKDFIRKGNNKCHNKRHLGRVNLMLGCGNNYFSMAEPIVNQIGAQMKDGSIDNITGEKFGWWIIWRKHYKTSAQRVRRQIEGSGTDDYEGDDYEYGDDGEDNVEAETEIPAVTTHAHRHHHGVGENELTENKLDTSNNHNLVNNDAKPDEGTSNLLLLNKNGNIDEEIVESVSQLESVITKTIENTKNIKELPEVVEEEVSEVEDDDAPTNELEKVLIRPNEIDELNNEIVEKNIADKVKEEHINLNEVHEITSHITENPTISSTTPVTFDNELSTLMLKTSTTPFRINELSELTTGVPIENRNNIDNIPVPVSEIIDSNMPIFSTTTTVTVDFENILNTNTKTTTPNSHESSTFIAIANSHTPLSSNSPSSPLFSSSSTSNLPQSPALSPNLPSLNNNSTSETAPSSSYSSASASASASTSSSQFSTTTVIPTDTTLRTNPTNSPAITTTLSTKNELEATSLSPNPEEVNASHAVSSSTPKTVDINESGTSSSSPSSSSSSTQLGTTPTSAMTDTTSPATSSTEYIEPKVENSPPMIRTRLPKYAVTSGKSFVFTISDDTFYDSEDFTNLRLELTDKDGHELRPSSWLQFNAETRELYGLPLEDAVSKYQYRLSATDSGNESVTEMVEMSVQQHRGVRSVNHEINIALNINVENANSVDWKIKLIKSIATTLDDSSTNSIVVREIRQTPTDPHTATFVYFNETLPTNECPETEFNNLIKRLDATRLNDLVYPKLSVKSITGQLIGACEKQQISKNKPVTHITKNSPPMPRNQVDRVNATVGHLLVYKVPSDTFYDPNDNELTLTLRTKDNKELGARHWLQFDSKNQEFYGIPKSGDIGSEEYLLVAEDSGGLSATDALVVVVSHAIKKEFTVYFKAHLAIRHEQFNADLQRKFVERISQLFGDHTTQNIQIRSVTTQHVSDSTIVNFYNTSLYKSHNRCSEEDIEAARNVYLVQEHVVHNRVKKVFGPELNLTDMQVNNMVSCHHLEIPHREFIPTKTEEPSLKSSFADHYMYSVILPAVIIISMILIAALVALCLHRRRHKSGKMELGDEEERKSFKTRGIPVIFQDELDEKPEIGNKSPIILKDEKPPLLPPSYNTSNMNGDNDVDEYVPPPAVVVGGREARGKSPATPSYRKPPPYVSP